MRSALTPASDPDDMDPSIDDHKNSEVIGPAAVLWEE